MEEVFGKCDWAVMLILTKDLQWYAEVRTSVLGESIITKMDVRVDWTAIGKTNTNAWIDEVTKMHIDEVITPVVTNYYTGNQARNAQGQYCSRGEKLTQFGADTVYLSVPGLPNHYEACTCSSCAAERKKWRQLYDGLPGHSRICCCTQCITAKDDQILADLNADERDRTAVVVQTRKKNVKKQGKTSSRSQTCKKKKSQAQLSQSSAGN
jgi:hypothetical protein